MRELSDTIAALIAARPRLKPMGISGRQWVFENLEPSVVVAKYLNMYEQAIQGKA